MEIILTKSTQPTKKFMVIIPISTGRTKTIHFGATGYSDYTKHKDKERMKRYENRHRTREDWNKSGIETAGFWSKWILWNKPSLLDSIKHTENKFHITIRRK